MYKHIAKVRCDVCRVEKTLAPSDYYRGADFDSQCKRDGWIVVHFLDYTSHICPSCREIVGCAHGRGLAEAALKQFDPQTYSNAELVWHVGGKYLSFDELVDLTHPKNEE